MTYKLVIGISGRVIKYCSGSERVNNDNFQADINTCGFDTKNVSSFKEIILSVFNKYAPIKKKYNQANEAPFMTKKNYIKKL